MGRVQQGRPGGRILAACLALLTVASSAAADFRDWSDSVDVYVNTSPSGANVANTLSPFPLLVRLDQSGFDFSKARPGGADIRFSKPGGAALPYQIERWDAAAGKAEVWVLVDTVKGNNATQFIRLYYGNSAAADSSNPAATFPASLGLAAVFHMGQAGTTPRANSAAGGAAATPGNYDGDESRPGIIGLADSLDGGAPGDWLDMGAGYADFSAGFTYSAWVFPSAVKQYSHFLDLGSGAGANNIIIGREGLTNHLIVHLYHPGGAHSRLRSDALITENAWQHIAVTITNTDSTVRWFKNGSLIESKKMLAPLGNAVRTGNWMGRSPWTGDEYFQGKLDEVRISRRIHPVGWIRMSYENQRPDQVLVTLRAPPAGCAIRFAPAADMTVDEGAAVTLASVADCASAYHWTPVSGPAPRILDPDVKTLQFPAPRVTQDTVIVFRFSATFPDSTRERDVRVTVKEAIPEPAFTLPATLSWDGRDSLPVTATVTNLAAIKTSRDSVLTWAWTVTDLAVDTAWRSSALVLSGAEGMGEGMVTLCLANGGQPTCKSTEVTIYPPTSIRARPAPEPVRQGANHRSADGRWRPGPSGGFRVYPAAPPR